MERDKSKFKALIIAIVIAILSVFIYEGAIAPKLYDKYLNTGIKYLMDGEYEEAILSFDKAIKIESKSTEARVYQAEAYIGNEEYNEAVNVLEEAQNIDIKNEELLKEILEILNEIDSDIAYEFLDRYINAVGKDNISEEIKDILNSAYETPQDPIVEPYPGRYIYSISVKLKLDKMKVGHGYYYTLDGTEPTKKSKKYIGKIQVDKSTEIKVIAFNKNDESTEIISLNYEIDKEIKNEIEKLIKDAQNLMDNVEVGTGIGNCIEGSKEEFSKVIKKSKKGLKEVVVSYNKAMKIKDDLVSAFDDFKYNIIEDTDKSELNTLINKVQKIYDDSVEGNKEGQYEVGSKANLLSVLKEAKELSKNILAKQDEINEMKNKITVGKKNFENQKIKAMPKDLANKYRMRISAIEAKVNAVSNDMSANMYKLRAVSNDRAEEYIKMLYEIYDDLNKYLPVSTKSEISRDRNTFEAESVEIREEIRKLEESGSHYFGSASDVTGLWSIGDVAEKHCLNLINKYMR